jgi:hypothetical protein
VAGRRKFQQERTKGSSKCWQGKKNRTQLANERFARPACRVRRGLGFLSLVDAKFFALRIAPP